MPRHGLFGIFFFGAFLTGVAAPAWWLGYLSLLGRPAANGGGDHGNGIRPGASCCGPRCSAPLIVTAALARRSGATRRASGRPAATRSSTYSACRPDVRARGAAARLPGIETEDPERLIAMLVVVLPPTAAVIAAITQTAQSVARRAYREAVRPAAPPVARPQRAVVSAARRRIAPAAVTAGAFVIPDMPGLISSLFAATLTIAFAILGLAVLHAVTRATGHRPVNRAVVLSGAIYALFVIRGARAGRR